MRVLLALPLLALAFAGCLDEEIPSGPPPPGGDGAGGPVGGPEAPADEGPPGEGTGADTVRYVTRSTSSLDGPGGAGFARDVWANVTLHRNGAGWEGVCLRSENETVSARDPPTLRTNGSHPVAFAPLRESTAVSEGDLVRVEYLRGCEVQATGLVVEGRQNLSGEEMWVARSPNGGQVDEMAWWRVEDGLVMGWDLNRASAVDRGRVVE